MGNISTKKAIIKFEEYLYGITDLDISQIAIGQSSTQLAINLFEVLLNEEDKILLIDPSYCNYPTQIISSLQNIELLRFPILNVDSWKYEADNRINEFITYILDKKPKVVLLIVPDNPTSQILSDSFIDSVLNAVKEIGSFLVIDYAYKEIYFKDKYPEYYSRGPNENYIKLHSNSKWCRGLGRRMGWIDAPIDVIESLESILNSSILCPDTLHQMAFTEYVNSAVDNGTLKEYVQSTSEKYKQAAELTIKCIDEFIGFPYLIPEGGLYTCMKVNCNSAEFVERILKSASVLFVPGWGFGRTLSEAVRISFGPLVNDHEKIIDGFKRVGKILHKN